MRRSVRPFWPLGGPFLLRPAVLGEALEPLPRQRHGVEVQMGVRLVCVLHHRAQPLAVLLPKPRHCRLTEPGPVLALLRGQDTTPAARARPSARSLRPLASWLLSAQSWASFAASAGVQPCSTWGGRGWATWGRRQARAWPRRRSLAPTICAAGRAAWSHGARMPRCAGIGSPWQQCSGPVFISIVTDYAYLR